MGIYLNVYDVDFFLRWDEDAQTLVEARLDQIVFLLLVRATEPSKQSCVGDGEHHSQHAEKFYSQ